MEFANMRISVNIRFYTLTANKNMASLMLDVKTLITKKIFVFERKNLYLKKLFGKPQILVIFAKKICGLPS